MTLKICAATVGTISTKNEINKMRSRRNKRRRKNAAVTVVTILVLAAILGTVLYLFQTPVVTISPNLRYAIGETVSLFDLVTEVKYGTLKNENTVFESQKAGTRQVTVLIENRLGRLHEETFVLEFYDDVPPSIDAPEALTVLKGEKPDLLQGATAQDENGTACAVSLSGDYDTNVPGTYTLTFSASDSSGNVATRPFTLTVLALPFDDNGKLVDGTYTTKKGFTLEVKGGIAYADGYLIANKSYALPKTHTSNWMSPETSKAYQKMAQAANAAGHNLNVKSAYRSWSDQDWIFRDYCRRDSLENALTYSARPGHSEHQTGLAMDLVASGTQEAKQPRQAAALAWLNENAYKYGFILRYPENKTHETGYIFESWHYRYVGEELAAILYNNGDWITMEDYFGIDSVYRGY